MAIKLKRIIKPNFPKNSSPFRMESPLKDVKDTITIKGKKEKVKTTVNPDKTITKSKSGKSTTYTKDPTYESKTHSKYVTKDGGSFVTKRTDVVKKSKN